MALDLILAGSVPTGTISASDVNSDITAIQQAINSFDGANIAAGTIDVAALTLNETVIQVPCPAIVGGTGEVLLPIDTTGDLIARDCAYYIEDDGTAAGTLTVEWGGINVAGNFSSAGTLVNAQSIPSSGSNLAANDVITASGTVSFGASGRILRVAFTAGTGQNNGSDAIFRVTLRFVTGITT